MLVADKSEISSEMRLAREVRRGLTAESKFLLVPELFYDGRGSLLFQKIMHQPEYYLPDCEREILRAQGARIANTIDGRFRVVEFGVGSGSKTEILLDCFQRRNRTFEFFAVDICAEAAHGSVASLQRKLPGLKATGIAQDYFETLHWLKTKEGIPTMVLFLGSSIGNSDEGGDRQFLRLLNAAMKPGDVAVVGFDLVKDESILIPAYSDVAGVTRDFNHNMLEHVNRRYDGNFNPRAFRHEARLNREKSRMESWLISTVRQTVTLVSLGEVLYFDEEEPTLVECSSKYTLPGINRLGLDTGFLPEVLLHDQRKWFCDAILRR